MLLLLFILLCATTTHVSCFGINNFHFPLGNVLFGNTPQARVKISGIYEMLSSDYDPGVPLSRIHALTAEGGPWACNSEIVLKEVLGNHISQDNVFIFQNNLDFLIHQVPSLTRPFDPVDLDAECEKIHLTATAEPNSFAFDLFVRTKNFGPILFVDYLGTGAFHYQGSENQNSRRYDSGKVVRFCDSYKWSGILYSLAPRPICPKPAPKHAKVGYGKMVLYKKNILAYHIPAYLCGITYTRVKTHNCWFCDCESNWPGWKTDLPGDLNKCLGTKEQKKHYPNPKGNDLNQVTDDKNQWLDCGPTPDRCREWTNNGTGGVFTMHDTGWLAGEKPGPFKTINNGLTWYYGDDPEFKCMDYKHQDERYYRAEIQNINVTVVMPDFYGEIPNVGHIRKSDIERGHFQSETFGTVVWDPKTFKQLCEYIPRVEMLVETMTYKGADVMGGLRNSDEMTFYFNDELHAAISTTDDQQLDVTGVQCVKFNLGEDIAFKLNTNEIAVFTRMGKEDYLDAVRKKGQVKHHLHSSLNQVDSFFNYTGPNPEHHVVQVVTAEDKDPTDINFNDVTQPKTQVSALEALDYAQHATEMERRRNLQIRQAQDCLMQQQLWDNFNQLLHVDPSVALTQKMNKPVKATHGGNNFYNVKKCDLVFVHQVIKSLRINDTAPIRITENTTTTIRDIVKLKGVNNPKNDMCLTYPLIVFSTTSEPERRLLGQLSFSGIIDIMQISHFTYCDRNMKLAFSIYNTTYYYDKFILSSTFPTDTIYMTKMQRGNKSIDTPINKHDEDKHNIHIFDLAYHGPQEKINTMMPAQAVSFNEYTIEEMQSGTISLAELINEATKLRHLKSLDIVSGAYTSADSGFFSGIGDLGDVLTGVAHFVADTVTDVVGGVGGSLGSTILKVLMDVITPLLPVIIVIIVVVVGGKIFYDKVLMNNGSKSAPRNEVVYLRNNDDLYNEERESNKED